LLLFKPFGNAVNENRVNRISTLTNLKPNMF